MSRGARLDVRTLLALLCGCALLPASSLAQPGDSTVTVVPGAQYRAGGLARLLLGSTYRDLWATPVTAPVLDLESFAGGLVAFEKGGSAQTRSLRLRAGDGRIFVFRALEKDPTQTWPEMYRRTPARGFAEDQISSIFPTGALAVSALEEAAGLLHVKPSLYVLPDHARLGPWREEFRGNLGLLEERVRGKSGAVEEVLGAREVITSDRLVERLRDRSSHRVDEAEYLRARLFDVFVGDWDRHADQWTWARFEDGDANRWVPVPRDRDWALSRLDGLLYRFLRIYLPQYQSFGPRVGSIYGSTLSGEPLDRRFLGWLPRATWDSIAHRLASALDDDAIRGAVTRLPATFPEATRQELASALRARRDALPLIAARFYRQTAGTVDLYGSDRRDVAIVEAEPDGALVVRLAPLNRPELAQVRRFDPKETREIRLYLEGGADSVVTAGAGRSPITVRVISGRGTDRVAALGPGVVLYDDDSVHATGVIRGGSSRPYAPPPVARASRLLLPRDWGARWTAVPWVEMRPEVGLLLGGGPVLTRYGFRKHPWASRLELKVAHATAHGAINAVFDGDVRFEQPDVRVRLRAAMLDVDVVRYYGIGNETARIEEDGFYNVVQRDYRIEPLVEWRVRPRVTLEVGPFLRASRSDFDRATLLALERPYGSGPFTEAGVVAGATYDSRDLPRFPTRGVRLAGTARLVPGWFDVTETFLTTELMATTYATASTLPASPTLALRAGAARNFGRYPFFEAASLGGRGSLRGFNSRRFAGDGAAHGSAELRLDLGGFTAIVPGEWGVLGSGDVGRVFRAGESSTRWHASWGGGLWFAMLDRRSVMALTAARSEERTRVYLQAGFHF